MSSQKPLMPLLFCRIPKRSNGVKTVLLLCLFLGGTLLYLRKSLGNIKTSRSEGHAAKLPASVRVLEPSQLPTQNISLKTEKQEVELRNASFLTSSKALAEEKSSFKLYIYDLPVEFNKDIVKCVVEKMGNCFKLDSFGMGPEFAHDGNISYRNSHMFALEIILHQKAMYSKYRTLDPHKADAFYIPYYSGLACFCPNLDVNALNKKMISHLKSRYPFLERGKPHLMALGKIEREQWTKHCSILSLPEAKRIEFVGIEEEFTPALRAHFGRRGRSLIVAPYPAFGHFRSSGNNNVTSNVQLDSTTRDVFVFLAASSRNAHKIRKALKPQFHVTTNRYMQEGKRGKEGSPVWFLTPECHGNWEGRVVEWMRHSVFCVQPPGDSPTRKSFYDAVTCGCVPVTFTLEHPVKYPFDKVLNYSDFTVIVDGKDVTERNKTILEILEKIPTERIKTMQDNLKKVAHLLQYSYPPTVPSKDAFTMVMEDMARRTDFKKRSPVFRLQFVSRQRP